MANALLWILTEIVFIYKVFQYEVETAEWRDERTGDGENDDHGKYQHHPGIMLAKPELQSDVSPDRRNLSLTSRQTELDEIPEQLGKPKYFWIEISRLNW